MHVLKVDGKELIQKEKNCTSEMCDRSANNWCFEKTGKNINKREFVPKHRQQYKYVFLLQILNAHKKKVTLASIHA